jgi:UDP-glucose 4-epimerase
MSLSTHETARCVLVTGGAGYIGSHTAWACVDVGWNVVILDDLSTGDRASVPPGIEFIVGDVADESLVARVISDHGIDAVLHFAGSVSVPESMTDPILYYTNNTTKTLALAKTAAAAGIKAFVFSSSAAVYAPAGDAPVAEAGPLAPINPYGRSKLMSEEMLADISRAHGLSIGILRYFNVAGADVLGRTGQRKPAPTHLITVACQAALGRLDRLPIFGADYPTRDGTCVRDYIHVNDLADAHILLLEHILSRGESVTLNCGYGRGVSVLEVSRVLEDLTGRPLPVEFLPRRSGDAASVVADVSKLRALLDWQPHCTEIKDIVASALDWERRLIREC